MAGDWLKMECGTPDKPEVLAITARMGWDDPDLTVGKLFRVWRWFDQHTTDGNAHGVTAALLDRIAGVAGFADAMASVYWLNVTDAGLSLPNFEKHNGATAKSRAQTAKRVANHRSNGEGNAACNAPTVTEALAREDKREEKIEKKERARGTRLPPDWEPGTEGRDFALSLGIAGEAFNTEACKFADYWASQPGQKGVKLDWPATWRNWCRKVAEYGPKQANSLTTPGETIEQYQARMAAERAADRARATPPPASVLAIVGRKPVEAA